MVQNGAGKCKRKALSGIEVKTIIEDDTECQKVSSYVLYNFKFSFALKFSCHPLFVRKSDNLICFPIILGMRFF